MWPLISPASAACVFLHLRLDERVARLPHDRLAAVLRDVVVERLRALHLADDRRARLLLQHRAREEDHQLVAPEDVALVVDHADAIGVAVVGDARPRPSSPSPPSTRSSEVLLDRRIRVVVREAPVHLAEERRRRRSPAPRTAAPRSTPPAPLPASTTTFIPFRPTFTVCFTKWWYGVTMSKGITLPAVVLVAKSPASISLRRSWISSPWKVVFPAPILKPLYSGAVVAAGDHRQAVDRERVRGEVGERRRHHADVVDVEPDLGERLHERVAEPVRGLAAVAADDHRLAALAADDRAQAEAELLDHLDGQILIDQPADVVLAKDVRLHCGHS